MIPEHTKAAIVRYVEHRIPPGGFLTAVLSNDLREAFGRADAINRASMHDIVAYVYNEIPSTCWGSREIVSEWLYGQSEALSA